MSFDKYLKSLDNFGLPTQLYYEEDKTEKKSNCGATVTITVIVIGFIYLLEKVVQM